MGTNDARLLRYGGDEMLIASDAVPDKVDVSQSAGRELVDRTRDRGACVVLSETKRA